MDDNQINEYIKNLPKSVQDVFFDDTWEERTIEVGKKYSLSEAQIEDLTNIVSLTLIGLQKPDDFLEIVISDLEISRLLAEQIVGELEDRVFEYALKMVEGKEKPKVSNSQTQTSRIPEIKPNNLPAVEIGQNSKVYSPVKQAELVQKPYGVPRFGMSEMKPKVEVINMNQNKPVSPQNMMDSKMNSVTVNMGDDFAKKQSVEPPKIPPTKYNTDPYREPLS